MSLGKVFVELTGVGGNSLVIRNDDGKVACNNLEQDGFSSCYRDID